MEDKVQLLNQLLQQAEAVKQQIAADRAARLSNLYKELAFDSTEDLIKALRDLVGSRAPKTAKAPKAPSAKKKRVRTKVTPEMRDQIIAMCNEGKSASEIKARFGVSVGTVQNIKKAAGLVKS